MIMKELPKSRIEFEVSVPWDKWEKYLDQAAAEASKEIKVDGFRPGKAPRHLIEQKVGKGVILNNAAEKAVQKSYADFVTEQKLEVIGAPDVEIKVIEEGKDLKYRAIAAIMPKIEVSEKYRNEIKKINKKYSEKKIEATDNEIRLELEKIANSRVKLITVARAAQKNDSVEVDFEVLVSGVPIENGTSKKHPLVLGKGVFIPGFEENLIGMKEGENKEFELEFPKDYFKKDLAGVKATFKVKMNLVQERQTPEINDEFAASLGKFKNLEEFKKNIKEGIEHEEEHKQKDQRQREYIEKIIENSKTEIPDILVEKEMDKMLQEFEYQIQTMGMNLDQYLEKLGKKKDDLKKDWMPQAEKRVISALALKEIIAQEEIKVEAAEVEAEMNKTLQYYKGVKDMEKNIDMEGLYAFAKGTLENEKVLEHLSKL
jgi:trigger factor